MFIWLVIFPPPAQAAIKRTGDIELIVDEPLFSSTISWYPGLAISRGFQVKNRGNGIKSVQIEAVNELDSKNLARGLTINVSSDGKVVYGESPTKTMHDFFDDRSVSLGDVTVDDNGRVFTITVSMPLSAGDEFQGGNVSFDMRVGFPDDAKSTVTISGGGTAVAPTPAPISKSLAGLAAGAVAGITADEETLPEALSLPKITPSGQISGIQPEKWLNPVMMILLLAGAGALAFLWWKIFNRWRH